MGADYTLDMKDVPRAVARVMELTAGAGADVVMEAVGLPETMESSVAYVASGGRVVVLGAGEGTVTFPHKVFMAKEIDFRGSRNSYRVFPDVIRLLESGEIRMKEFVSHRLDFTEAADAYRFVKEHREQVSKVLIMLS
jgi:threonine dehydrogenase-like Zn-dependent dehydrogenase